LEDRCLLAVGTIDPSFNGSGKQTLDFPGGSVVGSAVALQADGKAIVAGTFQPSGAGTGSTFAVARFNADGALDTGFGSGGRVTLDFGQLTSNAQASAVALQADGKIVVGGSVTVLASGRHDFALARLTAAGALDGTFGAGGTQTIDFGFDDFLTGLAIQPADQKVVAAGHADQTGAASFAAARLGTDGNLDAAFGSGGKELVPVGTVGKANAVALQPDGKIVLAGATGPSGGPDDFAAVRLTAAGVPDASFGSGGTRTVDLGGDDQANALALQADGKIVLAGSTTTTVFGQPNPTFAAARLNPDGSLDAGFGSGGTVNLAGFDFGSLSQQATSRATGVVVDPANKILLAGPRGHFQFQSTQPNTTNSFTLARLNPDGSPDISFHPFLSESGSPEIAIDFRNDPSLPQLVSQANGLALDPLGRAVVVGWVAKVVFSGTTSSPGPPSLAVARVSDLAPTTAGVFDPASATWYLHFTNAAGAPDVAPFAYGGAGWIPVVGDWNGDGVATVGVFDPATATWYLRNSNGPGAPDIPPFAYGGPGWIPVAGFWGGGGGPVTTMIGVVDPSTMTWYLKTSLSAGAPTFPPFQYGAPGDIPVVGDWDGNGTFTVGVFRPSNATWYLRNSNTAGAPDITPFAYGASTMKPVVGDWNSDGKWTVGVFDPNRGAAWLLRNSNTPGAPDLATFAYGAPAWTPVVGHYGYPPLPLPELAAGGAGPGAAALSTGDLNGMVSAALGRLRQAGVSPALVSRLSAVTALIQPLAPGQLGEALPGQETILLSPDGAGHGWFVDPTPYQDEEFTNGTALAGSPAAGREDLLTTVLHELGHLAGLADDSGSALMADALPMGTRRTDALNAVFTALGA
jgi:uncharacterized delta-60 repeat protein